MTYESAYPYVNDLIIGVLQSHLNYLHTVDYYQ